MSSLHIFLDDRESLIFIAAAVSSKTSNALSGSLRLIKYFLERLTASLEQSSSNLHRDNFHNMILIHQESL